MPSHEGDVLEHKSLRAFGPIFDIVQFVQKRFNVYTPKRILLTPFSLSKKHDEPVRIIVLNIPGF